MLMGGPLHRSLLKGTKPWVGSRSSVSFHLLWPKVFFLLGRYCYYILFLGWRHFWMAFPRIWRTVALRRYGICSWWGFLWGPLWGLQGPLLRSLWGLWDLFQRQLGVPLNVRDMLPERAIPDLPAPADGLEEVLTAAVPGALNNGFIFQLNNEEDSKTSCIASCIMPLKTRNVHRMMPDQTEKPPEDNEYAFSNALVIWIAKYCKHVGTRTDNDYLMITW